MRPHLSQLWCLLFTMPSVRQIAADFTSAAHLFRGMESPFLIVKSNTFPIFPTPIPKPSQKFRQYAHFVIAGIQFLKSVTMFISPLLVAWFVKTESDKAEWRMLFLCMAAVLFVVWIFADFQTKFHNTIFGPFNLWSHFTTYTFLETKFIITLLSFKKYFKAGGLHRIIANYRRGIVVVDLLDVHYIYIMPPSNFIVYNIRF